MPFNRKDGDHIEIRPRFLLKSKLSKDEILENLVSGLEVDKSLIGKKILDVFYLDIPKKDQKYWSPELRASIEDDEDDEDETYIRVVIGPRYKVWVFLIFIYAFLSLVCLFGGMYGMVQWDLGIESLWVYCFPVAFAMIVVVYAGAKIGQRATRDEMLHLTSYIYHNIKDENIVRVN